MLGGMSTTPALPLHNDISLPLERAEEDTHRSLQPCSSADDDVLDFSGSILGVYIQAFSN
jgi:hypothetical protein